MSFLIVSLVIATIKNSQSSFLHHTMSDCSGDVWLGKMLVAANPWKNTTIVKHADANSSATIDEVGMFSFFVVSVDVLNQAHI